MRIPSYVKSHHYWNKTCTWDDAQKQGHTTGKYLYLFCFKTIEQEGCYANKAYVGICHTQAISAARSFSSTDVRHITTLVYYLVFCDITYSQKSD